MNTSSDSIASTAGGAPASSYVSCIKVDGRPILPPIMNESIRAEMRRYRELAIRTENARRLRNKREATEDLLHKFPMNTTVTLESFPDCSTNNSPLNFTPTENPPPLQIIPAVFEPETSTSYHDHFHIKKPIENPSSDSEEHSQDSASECPTFKSDIPRSATYTKTPAEFLPETVNDQDEAGNMDDDDEDHRSEPMSLVSLDEKAGREAIETGTGSDSDLSLENYPPPDSRSGRSSTETFTIERHYGGGSDTENNNNDNTDSMEHNKYFFSPLRGDADGSIIFNSEEAPNTVKSRKYFQSPTPRPQNRDVILTEVSFATSISSTSTTTTTDSGSHDSSAQDNNTSCEYLTPKSTTSSHSGVARKFYFSSPETSPANHQFSRPSETQGIFTGLSDPPPAPVKPLTPTRTNVIHSEVFKTSPKRLEKAHTSPQFNLSSSSASSPTKIPRLPQTTRENHGDGLRRFGGGKSGGKSPEITPNRFNFTFTKTSPSPQWENPASNYYGGNKTPVSATQMNSRTFIKTPQGGSSSGRSSPKTPTHNYSSGSKKLVLSAPAKPVMNEDESKAWQTPVMVESKGSQGGQGQIGRVNLATLQMAMMNVSPNVFKVPPDTRSQLLKGVVFMDPLFRPKRELRIPPQALDPEMQPKFARITAAARGYLVRRLLRTEKLQMVIQTIRDTVELVLKLYEEVPQLKIRGWKGVKAEDADLCRRLFQQLTGACSSFHDVFFKLSTTQRMAIIANDREKIRAKELRSYLSRSQSVRGPRSRKPGGRGVAAGAGGNNSKRKISAATAKCLERRMSVQN